MVRRDDDSDDSLKDQLESAIRNHETKTQALVDRIVALESTTKEHSKAVALANKIVYSALAGAVALAAYVADKIWSRAEREGKLEIRMDYFERALDRMPRPNNTKDQP